MNKPTPGPWYLDYGEYESAGIIHVAQDGVVLAETMSQQVADKIVAIPDLLEALESVEWSATRRTEGKTGWCCPSCGAMAHEGKQHYPDCKLNKALKKARGEL
jgi:hypothetical protein